MPNNKTNIITIEVIKITFFLLLPVIVIPQLFSINVLIKSCHFQAHHIAKIPYLRYCAAFAYAAWKSFIGEEILYK